VKRTGAQIIVEALQKEGVRAIFGFPGGSVIDTFDEFFKANVPATNKVRFMPLTDLPGLRVKSVFALRPPGPAAQISLRDWPLPTWIPFPL